MGTVRDSIDNMIASSADNGTFSRLFVANVGSTTAANTTSGYASCQRFSSTLTLPSIGGSLTGIVFPHIRTYTDDNQLSVICGIEYLLGTLTVSGNSFVDGVAMPTKTIRGTSVQTAAQMAFVVATTALTATTPVLTITYKDQDGNGSQTATLTLPTSPALDTAFLITPHYASADTGMQDITNLSISTGSAGVLKVYGLLVLQVTPHCATTAGGVGPFILPNIQWMAAAADVIAFYRMGTTSAGDVVAMISGIAEN